MSSEFDQMFVDYSLARDYPAAPPEEQPSMDGVQLAAGPSRTMSDAGGDFGSIKAIEPTRFERALQATGLTLEQAGRFLDSLGQVDVPVLGKVSLADFVPFVGSAKEGSRSVLTGGPEWQGTPMALQQAGTGQSLTRGTGMARQLTPDASLALMDVATNAVPVGKTVAKVGKALAMETGKQLNRAILEGTGPLARAVPKSARPLNIVEPGGKVLPPIPVDKVQRQKNFKTWAEGAEIKADDGKPRTLYHATTHDFDTFSLERANAENHYGKGFYLTDSVDDANANYAGVGPDLKLRIELRSERLADEFADMDEQDVMDAIQSAGVDMKKYFSGGKSFADLDSKQTNEVLMQVAEKELKGHDGMVMPVFAKMKNPVKVGTKDETVFSIESQFDEAGDIVDETGNGIDLINAIREVGDEYNVDVEDVIAKITDKMYDGIRAGDVDRIMRENVYDVYTPDGEMAGAGQFIADVFQRMGFDGIEMNAEKYFGPRQGAWGGKITGMEGVQGAKHYILFDSKNIKSAIGNNGKFDPRDPNILHGGAAAGTAAGTATMQDKEQK